MFHIHGYVIFCVGVPAPSCSTAVCEVVDVPSRERSKNVLGFKHKRQQKTAAGNAAAVSRICGDPTGACLQPFRFPQDRSLTTQDFSPFKAKPFFFAGPSLLFLKLFFFGFGPDAFSLPYFSLECNDTAGVAGQRIVQNKFQYQAAFAVFGHFDCSRTV